ncbi:hypothetical protein CDD83_512 [Cordyceps sp. RAO-2017]|nr:hypothetical protein CDD83_512 [Cordyceps sp. RAO-2017]
MPALAAIINKAVPDDKEILLYYNTGEGQLAISTESGTSDDSQAENFRVSADDAFNSYILNPSQMGAAQYQGQNYVAAATMPSLDPGAVQTTNQISLLSPTYRKLGEMSLGNVSVAMCSIGDQAWVYYTETIRVMDLKDFSIKELRSTNDAWLNTSLSPYYDPVKKQRHIVYEGSTLMDYNVDLETTEFIQTVGNMQRNTPVAVSYHDAKLYVYYLGRGQPGVQRAVKDSNGWGVAVPVSGAPSVAESSQITVVTANGFNHLFYVAADEPESAGTKASKYFTHIRDHLK